MGLLVDLLAGLLVDLLVDLLAGLLVDLLVDLLAGLLAAWWGQEARPRWGNHAPPAGRCMGLPLKEARSRAPRAPSRPARSFRKMIKSELYGGGDKIEGRAALTARQRLDGFFFHTNPLGATAAELDGLKSAIIPTTLGEQVDLLDQARDAGGGIKAEMLKLMND